jgi:hypothetical protein
LKINKSINRFGKIKNTFKAYQFVLNQFKNKIMNTQAIKPVPKRTAKSTGKSDQRQHYNKKNLAIHYR